ncbi:zinc-dependent metalloprotease family protein, partial [Arthrobacter sp. YD2]|uniref:zinc-dependent metalloprotease family protein n=1 Tax=Arthrobacter sp. YD2 TaxID=3058046 RepID=UPI0025B5C453
MKRAKLALLALLATALTAGGLPAQSYGDLTPGPSASPVPATAPSPVAPTPGVGGLPADPTVEELPVPEEIPPLTAPDAIQTEPAEPTPAATEPEEQDAEHTEAEEDPGFDPVVGGGFPVPGPNTPMVTDPDGTVRSAVETDISAMHDHDHGQAQSFSSQSGGASTLGAAARSGTIQVTLVFATLTDNRGGVDQAAAKNSIVKANEYWRAASNGRLGMSIVETKTLKSTANSRQDYGAMMNTIRKDLRWYEEANEALVVFVPAPELRSGGYGGILGGGWTSGPTSGSVLMPKPSGFTNNVVTHELGHVLGLLHANSLKCNNGRSDIWINSAGRWADAACTSREYGDTSDLMGYAQYNLPMINSYFWDAGGFGRGDEILNAGTPTQAKTFTLRPWAGSASNRAVKFRDTSGETYYLELRLPVGYDAGTATGGNRGVKIVKADLANSWALNSLIVSPNTRDFAGYVNTNSTWQAGQTFTTHAGTTVKINSVSSSSASITIVGGSAGRAAGPIAAARASHPGLGAATSDVVGGLKDGGAYQNFANGAILWSPATGAHVSPKGAIRDAYQKSGFEGGPLGFPRSGEVTIKGGKYQDFQNGAILWSSSTGAHVSPKGAIRDAYQKSGFEGGPLGFPRSGEVTIKGGKYQDFQNGAILWSSST